jgi:hypothetical protein
MFRTFKALGILAIAAVAAACAPMQHGPEGVAYSTPSGGVGVTSEVGAGSVSGGSGSNGEKEQRGNTPIGMDRDGHGPAAGAIVDPTGAATRGKPY